MSRSGYDEYDDGYPAELWRQAVANAIHGKRGQRFFLALVAALDAMPIKRLIAGELRSAVGEVCAMGALGAARGVDVSALDPEYPEQVARAFDIAPALAQETAYVNDEEGSPGDETEERRWARVREWAARQVGAAEGRRD